MPYLIKSLSDDLSTFIGNATEKELSELEDRFGNMLAVCEEIRSGFSLIRDLFIFTSHRLIYLDYKGVTGIQVEFRSIPFKSLTSWSFESAGPAGISQTLRLWIAGFPKPFKVDFPRDADVQNLEVLIAEAVFMQYDQGQNNLNAL